ncbi:MAG: ZIP family metal transporter [Cytophagaceae bacterium]|jgi:zinc transporter ZupT|nr:ZIP family metal transporter [Cytophagaceae bacterium]
MWINASILFWIAFLPAVLVFRFGMKNSDRYKYILSFSGAYLFSITIIHILPEAITETGDVKLAGVFVLLGYYLQMAIEYFSTGVEHGHMHLHHHHKGKEKYYILFAMCLHGLMEGTLLMHPSHMHEEGSHTTLMIGMILHKIPEAFALATVLIGMMEAKRAIFGWQFLFALATPVGIYLSDVWMDSPWASERTPGILFALVAGTFMYISTTIFFEANPQHKYTSNRIWMALLGGSAAVLVEYIL